VFILFPFPYDCHSITNNIVLKIIFAENLVDHGLDVVAGMPVAVVIKAAGLFEDVDKVLRHAASVRRKSGSVNSRLGKIFRHRHGLAHSKTLREPGSAGNQLARVGDCARLNRTNLMGHQRDDRNRLAVQGSEFNFIARRAAMRQHHRADVARAQPVFGQVARENHVIQFFDHTASFFFSG
jgi:hypothetical protein